MKSILILTALLACTLGNAQTNILDTSSWTVGSGAVSGFGLNGTAAENVRELEQNPHGNSVVLWKAVPDAVSDKDGGWNSDYHNIDPTKTYRLTVWIKKTGNTNGRTYFGVSSRSASNGHTTLQLDGSVNTNAYFWNGDLPELDKWFLLVGFIHGSSHTGTTIQGGIYDGVTGAKIWDNNHDFKFASDGSKLRHRAYLYYNTDTNNRQYFWDPTMYEVNGQEPSISELLNPGGSAGSSQWAASGNNINYTSGKVGIGTANPDYELTVKGKIHAEEVKVDLSVPAPDYVFEKDYNLLPLKAIEAHIKDHGHLPNIPSAKVLEAQGIELGTFQMKLLEKIEELTLYLLEQERKIRELQQRKSLLENQLLQNSKKDN